MAFFLEEKMLQIFTKIGCYIHFLWYDKLIKLGGYASNHRCGNFWELERCAMTEKELRKLNRRQLLELLLVQTERADQLQKQLEEARQKLDERSVAIVESGSCTAPVSALCAEPPGWADFAYPRTSFYASWKGSLG